MATFGGIGPYRLLAPVKQDVAASDPESLIEDMWERAEAPTPDWSSPEWTGIVNSESLPSNRFGGLEPD